MGRERREGRQDGEKIREGKEGKRGKKQPTSPYKTERVGKKKKKKRGGACRLIAGWFDRIGDCFADASNDFRKWHDELLESGRNRVRIRPPRIIYPCLPYFQPLPIGRPPSGRDSRVQLVGR